MKWKPKPKKQHYEHSEPAKPAKAYAMKNHIALKITRTKLTSAAKLMHAVITQTDGTNYLKKMAFSYHGETQSFNIPMSYGSTIKNFG